MRHFAQIGGLSAFTLTTTISTNSGTENITLSGFRATVLRGIVAEQSLIDSGIAGDPSTWIEFASPLTTRIRNISPQEGYIYESIRDIFYPPQPYPSWVFEKKSIKGLDENNNIIIESYSYNWVAPVPYPDDGQKYVWNETTLAWDLNT
jgi:hypothetical protein